jgi:hypothetical protein
VTGMTEDSPAGYAGRTDEGLLGELRRIAVAVDGVPEAVTAAARAAFLLRDLDGQLAVLIADSLGSGPRAMNAVRAGPQRGRWLLSFSGGGIEVDMEVSELAGRVRLCGRFAGMSIAAGEQVCVETPRSRRQVMVDALGRFVVEDVVHGPLRLRCPSAGGPVITAWVTV